MPTPQPETSAENAIDWQPWSDEAFQQARDEEKLLLVDSGATWCHWCHVMDRVTYEDDEIAELVGERFVPVRIDRDRRPRVDAWLQRAAPIVESAGNGWPLTVVMTPAGHVLFKATFLPPRRDERYGASVGLADLLRRLDELWRTRGDEVRNAGEQLAEAVARQRDQAPAAEGEPDEKVVEELYAGIAAVHDRRHGGFGQAPKFFHAPALRLAAVRAFAGDGEARELLVGTLSAMADGGIRDHVGGGFHRYSVDDHWHVPHFEKMAGDNAALLALYADAAALTGTEAFADVALGTRGWVDGVLGGDGREGFFASRDADVGLDDDGDYFTWTVGEFRQAVGEEDADALIRYFGVDAEGDVHGRPGRNVLRVAGDADIPADVLDRGLEKLRAARRQRSAPGVDRTVFADLNGQMISAYLTAFQRLGDEGARDTALATLDHLLATLRDERGVFAHYRDDGGLRNVGLLADQAWMTRALLDAHAVTAEAKYLQAARALGEYVLGELADPEAGGFFDGPAGQTPGAAAIDRTTSWEDSPGMSASAAMSLALPDLAHRTGQQRFAAGARRALASRAGGIDRRFGLFLAGYALAVEQLLHGPRTVAVVADGGGEAFDALVNAARSVYIPGGSVLAMNGSAPPEAELLGALGLEAPDDGGPVAYVCRAAACLAPARTPEELRARLAELAGR